MLVIIFFILINKAYHSQEALYITMLIILCLILINHSFNLSALTLQLLIRNGDHCEYFLNKIHLSDTEGIAVAIKNRLPFFQQNMMTEGLHMIYELRNSYITLLNFYQVRTEQYTPLELKSALTPSQVHRNCRAKKYFSDK